MTTALWGTPLAAVGTILLLVFAGSLALHVSRMRRAWRGEDIAALVWLVHGTIYYLVVLVLRARGVALGGPLTEAITLWSSALRLHIVISVGAAEILRRRYGRVK